MSEPAPHRRGGAAHPRPAPGDEGGEEAGPPPQAAPPWLGVHLSARFLSADVGRGGELSRVASCLACSDLGGRGRRAGEEERPSGRGQMQAEREAVVHWWGSKCQLAVPGGYDFFFFFLCSKINKLINIIGTLPFRTIISIENLKRVYLNFRIMIYRTFGFLLLFGRLIS